MFYKISQVKPYISKEEYIFIKKSLDSKFITEGKLSKKFLSKLLKITNAKYGVLAPNGTLAIALAIMAMDLKRNDEIIIPNFTFFGTFSAAILAGVKPVLCDVDKQNFQICLNSAKNKITKKTKAIMPVHIYGGSVDMISIKKFAKKYNLKIIEDAAQALGVKYYKKSAGSFGDVSAFSFYGDKSLTTGEGGLIVTNSKSIYKKLLLLRNQGRYNSGKFLHPNIGYNFRFNDILSAIGLAQLKKFSTIKKRKLNIYNLYKKELKNVREVIFFKPIKASNFVPFRVPLIVKNKIKLIKYLEKNKIQTREFFYPLDKQPAVKKILKNNSSNKNFFKNSYYAYKNGLALPCYPDLRISEIKYICNKIKNFYTFAK